MRAYPAGASTYDRTPAWTGSTERWAMMEAAAAIQAEAPARMSPGPQAAYGVGQVAGQIFRDVPSLLLLFFMTTTLGIQPALAGIAIFVPKLVWGMACDVGVGVISDRIERRMARKWWLVIGACGAPAAIIALFHVPVLGQTGRALYVAGVFSFYMLVFATFSVPYLAIAAELSGNPEQRTILMAWRLVFTSVGVLVADSLAPILIQVQHGGQLAYQRVALFLAACCTGSLVIAFFGSGAMLRRSNAVVPPGISRPSSLKDAMAALAERRFSVLLAANLFQLAGGGMAYASMLYFLSYTLNRSDAFQQLGFITIIACATIIGAQPLWVFLARRWGKKNTYVMASLFYGATMAGWSLLGQYGIGISYFFALLLGVSNSGWTLMGFSMVADIAGEGRAGLYSSVWIAADKIGFALGGALLVSLVLSGFGFDSSRAMAGLPQSAMALHGVVFAYGIFPGCLSAVAAAMFWRWGRV